MGKLIKKLKGKTDSHSTVRTLHQKKNKRKRKSSENRESSLLNRDVQKGMHVDQSMSLENKIEELLKATQMKQKIHRKMSSMNSAVSSLDESNITEKVIGKYVRPLKTQSDQPLTQIDMKVKKRRKRRSKGHKLYEDNGFSTANNITGNIKFDKNLEVVNNAAEAPEAKKNRKRKCSAGNESLHLGNIIKNKPDKKANDATEGMEVVKKKQKRKRTPSTGNERIDSNSREKINNNRNKINEQKSQVKVNEAQGKGLKKSKSRRKKIRNSEATENGSKEINRLKQNNVDKKEKIIASNKETRNTSLEVEKLKPDKKKNLSLREKMLKQLKSSRFRYINEQLYTVEGKIARKIFRNDPEAFKEYHLGYKQQVNKWPINPVDVIIKSIKSMPRSHVVADLGCGEAKIAATVKHKVHCFDLIALNDSVIPCDMAHVPLEDDYVDVVVFCLSLMGTNLQDYLLEANRILKTGGIMKIAEVESRFENLDNFISLKKVNVKKKQKLPVFSLKPCLYKKR